MPEQQWTFRHWGCLVIAGLCLILILWLPIPLLGGMGSRVEVARIASPDGGIDAVLVETNGGATTSFGYQVHLVPSGEAAGNEAALLYAATRRDCAFGVNLRWAGPNRLLVEYQRADRAQATNVAVGGHPIQVQLKPGTIDPAAPCGGMEYNLRGRPHG